MGLMATAAMKQRTPQVDDFLVIYKALVDALRVNNKLAEAGRMKEVDTMRFHRLEAKVNAFWEKMTRDEQIVACAALIKDDYMDSRVAEIITMWNGKITASEPPEPCMRIKP